MSLTGVLPERNGRWNSRDLVCIRFRKLVQILSCRGREGFEVAPLTFGVESIEGQAGFARATDATDRDQLIQRDIKVDIFQVMDPHPPHLDDGRRDRGSRFVWQVCGHVLSVSGSVRSVQVITDPIFR